MKKIYKISFLLITIILLTGCTKPFNKNKQEVIDKAMIGESNPVNNDIHQIKVIHNYINIRKNPSVDSDKIGEVEKDSVFDFIEFKSNENDKFIWFHIKTNNNIDGWIASNIEEPYLSFNWDFDYLPPTLKLLKDSIEVDYRSNILEVIKKNIEYSDDKDPNPSIDYELDENSTSREYKTKINVTDSSGNITSKYIKVILTSEKRMSNGNWIDYKEFKKLQSKAKIYCYKYGLIANEDRLSCRDLLTNVTIDPSGIYISDGNNSFCYYDIDFNPSNCLDKGNTVNHDLMPNSFISNEKSWIKKITDYKQEVKTETGYDYSELKWE